MMKNIHKYIFTLVTIILLSAPAILLCGYEDYYWQEMEVISTDNGNYNDTYWYELYFLPDKPNCGFVCGGDGAFAKTTDSGKTWYASRIKKYFHAESVYFADENIGYVSGPEEPPSNAPQCIFKTIDGGKTWKDITPKGLTSAWGHYIIGKDDIWLLHGNCVGDQYFFKSTNGGGTWDVFKAYHPNSALTDLVMYEKNGLGYAVGSGIIWQTLDGGISWECFKPTPKFNWKYGNTTEYNWHEDLQIYNNSFLIPASTDCSGTQNNGEGGIAFSTDKCQSWQTFKTKGAMFGTFILGDSSGWACGTNQEVYYTLDAGQTWVSFNCGIPYNKNLDDLWFFNDTTGLVCGEGIYSLAKKKKNVEITYSDSLCNSALLSVIQDFEYNNWYEIKGTDTIYIDNGKEIIINNTGKYFVEAFDIDCYSLKSVPIDIEIPEDITIKLISDRDVYCINDTAKIWFEPKSAVIDFYWSENNIKEDTLKTTQAGEYTLTYTDSNMCKRVKKINIYYEELVKPELEKIEQNLLCAGDTAKLKIKNFNEYKRNVDVIWYQDDNIYAKNVSEIAITKNGNYSVYMAINEYCFQYSDTMFVTFKDEVDRLSFEQNDTPFFIDSVKYSKLSCRNFKINNVSGNDVILDNIFLSKKIAFTTPMEQFPIVINANSTKDLLICYSPTDLNIETDTILIPDNCSIHSLSLYGVGVGNKDSVISDCDVPIIAATKEIIKKKIFDANISVSSAYKSITKINYSLVSEENSDIKLSMTDYLGRKISLNYTNNVISNYTDLDYVFINGEIEMNTESLSAGIYFVYLRHNDMYKILNLIVFPN